MQTKIVFFLVGPQESIRQAISRMDQNKFGALLVADESRRLLGIVTDGDVRRAILADMNLDGPAQQILDQKKAAGHGQPITARADSDRALQLDLLRKHSVFCLPLVDGEGKVAGLATMDDFLPEQGGLPMEAVVMAGGLGTRLWPLTANTPKPMLPVGGKPLIQRIVEQLEQVGIRKVYMTTHYRGEVIEGHFGDGKGYGVDIEYVQEGQALGTAGALGLLKESKEPLLVINGDIVTDVDFRRMLFFHQENEADMTVAVRQCNFRIPYGVVEVEDASIVRLTEKPVIRRFISAGIYLINPQMRRFISPGQRFDMPDLINQLVQQSARVVAFPVREYWVDIGQKEEYERVQEDLKVVKVQ